MFRQFITWCARGSIYLVITAREALIWEYDDRKSTADMTVTSLSLALRHLAQENATFEFVSVRIHKQYEENDFRVQPFLVGALRGVDK